MSKRRNSPIAAANPTLVKTKCWDVDDLDLIGVTREAGKQTEGLFAKDGGTSAPPAAPSRNAMAAHRARPDRAAGSGADSDCRRQRRVGEARHHRSRAASPR